MPNDLGRGFPRHPAPQVVCASPTAPPRRFRLRMPPTGQMLRIGIGALLVLLAGLFLHDRFGRIEASQAMLHGIAQSLRAPIDGTLTVPGMGLPAIGSILEPAVPYASVINPRAEDRPLREATTQLRMAEAERDALRARIAALTAEMNAAERQAGAFRHARAGTLDARVAEAENALAAADARLREAETALRRGQMLAQAGVVAGAALDQTRRAQQVATSDRQAAANRLAALRTELNAASGGVFASDNANDRSASQQARDRLGLMAAELNQQLAGHEARIAGLADQRRAEEARFAQAREAPLHVGAQARLLRQLAQPGEHVRQGQEIAQFVDCANPVVTAQVDGRVFRSLRLGQPAQFQAAGESAWQHGNVAALMAPAATAERGTPLFEVIMRLDPHGPAARGCETARLGRLSF
ncbi:MAG: hypothetical protein NTW56_00355 [Alphaproteobacteria bacterium]|nr:hypothetical protein [Alphaproteobacteria bacterium]